MASLKKVYKQSVYIYFGAAVLGIKAQKYVPLIVDCLDTRTLYLLVEQAITEKREMFGLLFFINIVIC